VTEDLARQEAVVRSETRDDAGRKLWRTAHNDLCEVCGKEGNLLLCSYCNTSWFLQCTGEQLIEAPEGYWMCGMWVEAEREGDDMTHHGLPGDDEEEEAPVFDPSVDDADDEDGETDISEAAYDTAGILPFPPSIWACHDRRRPEEGTRSPSFSSRFACYMCRYHVERYPEQACAISLGHC